MIHLAAVQGWLQMHQERSHATSSISAAPLPVRLVWRRTRRRCRPSATVHRYSQHPGGSGPARWPDGRLGGSCPIRNRARQCMAHGFLSTCPTCSEVDLLTAPSTLRLRRLGDGGAAASRLGHRTEVALKLIGLEPLAVAERATAEALPWRRSISAVLRRPGTAALVRS